MASLIALMVHALGDQQHPVQFRRFCAVQLQGDDLVRVQAGKVDVLGVLNVYFDS